MAKAKNLAILAGLAGLAYANRDKLFGSKSKDDAGKSADSNSYTRDTKKVAASDDRMSNEDYIKSRMKKAPEDEKGSAQSDVLKAVTAAKEAPNDKAGNQGVIPPKSSGKSAAKAVAPSGMTDAQNNALANAGKKSKATAENNALAKVNRGMDREVTEAAKYNAAPTPVATTTQAPAASTATANKFKHEMPISKFFKGIREAGNRGNPDVKMASGGMTASRRGDGIAQRGKTRGKMC